MHVKFTFTSWALGSFPCSYQEPCAPWINVSLLARVGTCCFSSCLLHLFGVSRGGRLGKSPFNSFPTVGLALASCVSVSTRLPDALLIWLFLTVYLFFLLLWDLDGSGILKCPKTMRNLSETVVVEGEEEYPDGLSPFNPF